MADINKKLDIIEERLKQNKKDIEALKKDFCSYITIPLLYQILYETIHPAIFNNIEKKENLKICLQTTFRGCIKPFKEKIIRTFKKVETESPIFSHLSET